MFYSFFLVDATSYPHTVENHKQLFKLYANTTQKKKGVVHENLGEKKKIKTSSTQIST